MKHGNIFLLTILALALLSGPVIQAYARPPNKGPDPTVTAVRTGGAGGGDGFVTFTIDNTAGSLSISSLKVTIVTDDEIKEITGTPQGWIASSIVLKNGKGISVTWTTSSNPVPAGGTLGRFQDKMVGHSPYIFDWVLTNSAGGTSTGTVTAN